MILPGLRIQTAVETDGDGLNDVWFVASAEPATLTPIGAVEEVLFIR